MLFDIKWCSWVAFYSQCLLSSSYNGYLVPSTKFLWVVGALRAVSNGYKTGGCMPTRLVLPIASYRQLPPLLSMYLSSISFLSVLSEHFTL